MMPLLADTTISANANGTLSIIDTPPAPGPHQTDPGEINFAKLYGVDTTSSSTVPQHYNLKEVEGHYLAGGVQKAQTLSEEGLKLYETVKKRYLEAVPRCPHGSPSLYLTGGLPGSGKGHILSRVMKDRPEFVKVDPDEIKKLILRDLVSKNPETAIKSTASSAM